MRIIGQLILTFLFNATWQVALIVTFATLGDWLLRGVDARYRHALWIITLIACISLPGLSSARAAKVYSRAQNEQTVPVETPIVISRIITAGVEGADQESVSLGTDVQPAPTAGSSIQINRTLALTLVGLFSVFLLWRVLALLRAWRRTRSILTDAVAVQFPVSVQSVIDKCQRLLGAQRARFLSSAAVPVPLTLGFLRPAIVLPESLLGETDYELLTSAIGHELVHVRRRDYLWNLLFEIALLPLSFHPAVFIVRRRIRQTRELCCDQTVAMKLMRPEVYARSLIRLIGSAPLSPGLLADTAIGLNQSDILEVRIMSLLNSTKVSARRAQISLIAAILVLLAPCVVAAPFAFAFDLDRQEPAANSQEKQEKAQQERKKLEELKRQTRELKEKLQSVDQSERAEVEARLLEAEKNLEEHQRAMKDMLRQRSEADNLRASADATVERASEALKLKEQLAQLETQSPRNENELREVRERLKELVAETQQNRKVKVIYRVEPEYTADAKEKQIEGTVVLGVTIDHEGAPQNIQVKKSLFPSLDNAAVEALRKWRFEPALKEGQPASMYITVEFFFSPNAMESKLKGKEERSQREQEESEAMKAESDTDVIKVRRDKEREEQEQTERARRQSELTRDAAIPMDRAIQIATSQVPGKVLACSLGRDGSMVFYHVVIISGEGDQSAATYLWISAADGHVIKTEKEKRPRTF